MIILFFIVAIDSSVKDAIGFVKTQLIKIAISADPPAISLNATIADYDGTMLREDINQWVLNTEGKSRAD